MTSKFSQEFVFSVDFSTSRDALQNYQDDTQRRTDDLHQRLTDELKPDVTKAKETHPSFFASLEDVVTDGLSEIKTLDVTGSKP